MTHRTQYATFTLRGDKDGVVHLQGELPEIVAIGYSAWQEFWRGDSGPGLLGGPHAEVRPATAHRPAQLHITTPEGQFTYQAVSREQDKDGPYVLARLIFTDRAYSAFLAGQ